MVREPKPSVYNDIRYKSPDSFGAIIEGIISTGQTEAAQILQSGCYGPVKELDKDVRKLLEDLRYDCNSENIIHYTVCKKVHLTHSYRMYETDQNDGSKGPQMWLSDCLAICNQNGLSGLCPDIINMINNQELYTDCISILDISALILSRVLLNSVIHQVTKFPFQVV